MQAVSPHKHTSGAAPELTVITDDSIAQWESTPQKSEGTRGWEGFGKQGVGCLSCMDSWMDGYMDVKGKECMDG